MELAYTRSPVSSRIDIRGTRIHWGSILSCIEFGGHCPIFCDLWCTMLAPSDCRLTAASRITHYTVSVHCTISTFASMLLLAHTIPSLSRFVILCETVRPQASLPGNKSVAYSDHNTQSLPAAVFHVPESSSSRNRVFVSVPQGITGDASADLRRSLETLLHLCM